MITEYIKAALHQAQYELMKNGRYFGSMPACPGCWADGATLEATRDERASVLESWLLIKISYRDELAVIGGIDLNTKLEYAEVD